MARKLADLPATDMAWLSYWRSVGWLTSEPVPAPPAPAGDLCAECGEPFVGGEEVDRHNRQPLTPARYRHSVPGCLSTARGTPAYGRVLATYLEREAGSYDPDPEVMRLAVEELRRR